MDETVINTACRLIWGGNQAEMAREIDVNKSTVQDWRQGRSNPRAGVYMDVLRIAVDRQADIDALIEALRRQGGGEP